MKNRLNSLMLISGKLGKLAKLLKGAKVMKAMISVASMAVFAACESAAMGWFLGLPLFVLVLLHEMGHCVSLHRNGHGMKLPLFIPFIGAAIFAPKFESREKEADVALCGPILGTLAALLFIVPFLFTADRFWLAACQIGLILNLFNLLPLSPLDGGRVTQIVDDRIKWIGWAALIALTATSGNPGMLFIWIICIDDMKASVLARCIGTQSVFWPMMIWMIASGKWDAIAILFGGVCTFVAFGRLKWNEPEVSEEARPLAETRLRIGFLAAYLLLAGGLVYGVGFIHSMLP